MEDPEKKTNYTSDKGSQEKRFGKGEILEMKTAMTQLKHRGSDQ